MTLGQKLFGFGGRLRRRDWWLLGIAVFVVRAICMDLSRLILFGPAYAMVAPGTVDWSTVNAEPRVQILNIVFTALTIWPAAALASKRLHDRDRAAAPVIALTIVVFAWDIAFVLAGYALFSPFTGGVIGTCIMIALRLYLLVILGVVDGTKGPNGFGPSPKTADVR